MWRHRQFFQEQANHNAYRARRSTRKENSAKLDCQPRKKEDFDAHARSRALKHGIGGECQGMSSARKMTVGFR
ncbi:hypothetical protein M413DRAFT_442701 [Hebeloma cylindrosporum]|uniref:Uncharacterized protein n=1 Tax=Hebeloma cylindrosporum TaxID=76867 RepID=A0A0C3C7B2_HEBCY|nr:hypothetical protein M413DRAFT_442701 [Hebeloma cylindrosporum h7]